MPVNIWIWVFRITYPLPARLAPPRDAKPRWSTHLHGISPPCITSTCLRDCLSHYLMSSTFILSSNYLGVSNSTPKPPLLLLVFLSSLFLQTAYSPSTIHNHTMLEKREKSLKALPKPAQRHISHSFPRRDDIHLSDFWTAAFLIIPQHPLTSKQQNKLIRKANAVLLS